MKTLTAACIAVFIATFSSAQQPVTMIDYAPGSAALQSSADIKSALDQLLTKAQSQLNDLDKQLQRTGDYAAPNRDSVTAASTAIVSNGMTPTKSTAQLVVERAATTGSDVFKNSADGVFKGIGDTYTSTEKDSSGNFITKKRDADTYTNEAKKLYDISEFYRVRDAALAKQQALEAARLQAHLDLLNTQDEVETQRLTAQISTIDSELIAVRQDVSNASEELAIHEKAITLQQSADAKAKMESLGHTGASMTQSVNDMATKVRKMVEDTNKTIGTTKAPHSRLP